LGRLTVGTVVACSQYVKEGTERLLGIPPRTVVFVYNGIPLDEFWPERCPQTDAQVNARPVIGMVGRLDATKDYETLVDAAAQLKAAGKKFEMWFIGEGALRGDLEQRARSSGVGGEIKFLGMRKDVVALLRRMDIFAYSVKPEEGFGIALVEAMATGVPVISSDVGACREVLDAGRVGILVQPGDPGALAEAITRLLEDVAGARERAAAARERAVKVFSDDAMARGYAAVLGLPWLPAAPHG
jgi:glycosyltransferase involved in cell wall biosynthesis